VSKLTDKLWWVFYILILGSFLVSIPFIASVNVNNLDQNSTIKKLKEQGYTDIKIINDQFITGAPYRGTNLNFSAQYITAEAIDPLGKRVEMHIYSVFPFGDTIKVETK
jgi:hypothetical protein